MIFSLSLSNPLFTSHPKPFECSIQPRSEKTIAMINTGLDDSNTQDGDGEYIRNLKWK